MNTVELPIGTRFGSRSGLRSGTVGRLLGEGGQGAVYEVEIDAGRFALKWYHDHYVQIDSGLYPRLAKAVERGAPDPRFLWPLELVRIQGSKSFGYVMPLRNPAYVGMRDLIAPPPKRVELELAQRAKVCAHIAHCFLELHASGFCYQDINFGNIFLDPVRADVLICDNDNVNIDGADASIYGTRKFMAPEVVRREVLPSTKTDLFSMAVMFFYVVFGWHPLDGRREAAIRILDADAENRLYGTDPLFLFDPRSDANGPVEGMHDAIVCRWRSLSEDVRTLFVRSFTTGLSVPGARVGEHEWRNAFTRLADKAFRCAGCGYENVADMTSSDRLTPERCVLCGSDPSVPPVMLSGKRLAVLEAGRQVSRGAFEDGTTSVLGMVDAHPTDARVLGLRNVSNETWRAEIPGYSAAAIAPGKTIRLFGGLKLDFGRTSARVINPGDTRG